MDAAVAGHLVRHVAGGVAVGWTTLAGLLWWDVAGLASVLAGAKPWILPALMLLWAFGATFGLAALATSLASIGLAESTRVDGHRAHRRHGGLNLGAARIPVASGGRPRRGRP